MHLQWMVDGVPKIHEDELWSQLNSRAECFTESPYRKVQCKFCKQARKETRDKCRMFVNILINSVSLVFYHGT